MAADSPRVLFTLAGDVRQQNYYTKYGYLVEALKRRLPVVGFHDANLQGAAKLWNALSVFHLNPQRWKQRYWKNLRAFRARSRGTVAAVGRYRGRADAVLQVGVTFDAGGGALPNVIYTDYTAALSARKKEAGRSPFTARQGRRWQELERRAYERAAFVCTRGRIVRESIVRDYGIDPSRVVAIGGGPNFAALPELAPTADGATALFIGKQLFRKGGDLLLRAFAQVRERRPGARLLLLTAGPVPAELPLDGVEVIAPTWDREKIAALYRRADLFVLPSRLETWGDVLLEAMAYGLPCVGVAGDAMEEIIDHETTGLVVAPGDVDALAAALTRLFAEDELRRRCGQAGRERLEAHFTWDRVAERLAGFLGTAAADAAAGN